MKIHSKDKLQELAKTSEPIPPTSRPRTMVRQQRHNLQQLTHHFIQPDNQGEGKEGLQTVQEPSKRSFETTTGLRSQIRDANQPKNQVFDEQ